MIDQIKDAIDQINACKQHTNTNIKEIWAVDDQIMKSRNLDPSKAYCMEVLGNFVLVVHRDIISRIRDMTAKNTSLANAFPMFSGLPIIEINSPPSPQPPRQKS